MPDLQPYTNKLRDSLSILNRVYQWDSMSISELTLALEGWWSISPFPLRFFLNIRKRQHAPPPFLACLNGFDFLFSQFLKCWSQVMSGQVRSLGQVTRSGQWPFLQKNWGSPVDATKGIAMKLSWLLKAISVQLYILKGYIWNRMQSVYGYFCLVWQPTQPAQCGTSHTG